MPEQNNQGTVLDGHTQIPCRPVVLVAEDHAVNQKVICSQLAELGLGCDIAGDGELALAKWREQQFALLITDLHMPRMDDYLLIQSIRKEETSARRMPIIALSASKADGEKARSIAAGADEFLTKPTSLEVLKAVLSRWITGRPELMQELPTTRPVEGDSQLPVFDAKQLISLVGAEPALIDTILADFLAAMQKALEEIETASLNDNLAAIGSVAHQLKSSARSVGAWRLGNTAAELEQAGKSGKRDEAGKLVPALVSNARVAETGIQTFRSNANDV